MTLQKTNEVPKSPDYAFRRRYCRHKVWVSLKNGRNKTFYAKDCNATFLQISCGRVKQVLLDQQASLNDCLALEKYFKGKYITLQIYRRLPDGSWPEQDDPYMKFVNDDLVEQSTDPLPPNIHCEVQWKDVGFILVPIESTSAPESPAPTADPVYAKAASGGRTATGTNAIGQLLKSGSAGKYGFTR